MNVVFNFFMWTDPVTPILDQKELGLALISVVLFVGATVYNVLINNKLQDLKNTLDELKKQLDEIADGVKSNESVLEVSTKESHEQWVYLNKIHQLSGENALHLTNLADSVKDIAQQTTILAASQLNQAQQNEKVVAGLLDVLQDHSRD